MVVRETAWRRWAILCLTVMGKLSTAELMRRGPLWESEHMNIRGCGRRASRVVPNVTLTPTVPFADLAIEEERPIVLRNSQASLWPALKRWGTAGYLARRAPTLLEARTLDVAANVPFGAFVAYFVTYSQTAHKFIHGRQSIFPRLSRRTWTS